MPIQKCAAFRCKASRVLFDFEVKFLLIALLIAPRLATADNLPAQVLAELNLARSAPRAYAALLSERLAGFNGKEGHRVVEEAVRFLQETKPCPVLVPSSGLRECAASHVAAQGMSGGFGHGNFASRVRHFGQWREAAGENIQYGVKDARGIVMALIVDDGIKDRAHRLAIFNSRYGVAGVACGAHTRYGAMCVIDFAGSFMDRAGD
ncbi:MAG: Cysteine-rich secretory protein family [Chthoniobacteraceae bacterium]|nr:Cysteine-rich secretory protein family [Chthoniobacteraceae bacterium]